MLNVMILEVVESGEAGGMQLSAHNILLGDTNMQSNNSSCRTTFFGVGRCIRLI
jgi:hypothetical protein